MGTDAPAGILIALVLALVVSAASCASAPDAQVQSARDYIRAVTGDDPRAGGGLRVGVRTAVADGRMVRINGTIANRYDRSVEGVRYTVRFVAAGDPPRVVETVHEESADTVLDPGEERLMRIEIENPIRATAPGRFDLEAAPMRLDGQEVPPPPGWR